MEAGQNHQLIEIQPDCASGLPFTWSKCLSIQANMFCPITECSSIVKHLTPRNLSCKSDKFWPFSLHQFLPLIGNFKNECNVIPLMLNVDTLKYEENIQ